MRNLIVSLVFLLDGLEFDRQKTEIIKKIYHQPLHSKQLSAKVGMNFHEHQL